MQEELLEAQEREQQYQNTIEGLVQLVDRLVVEALSTRVISE